MKRFACEKCGNILPKGDIICDKCRHSNEQLFHIIIAAKQRQRFVTILILVISLIALGIIFNVFMLFPWQYQARHNKKAILSYVRDNYPNARIVEEYYPSMKFNPTNKPYDSIVFELNGVQFAVRGRDGKVNEANDDLYGAAVIQKEVREGYLNNFFSQRALEYEADIDFLDYYPRKTDNLSTFQGNIFLEFRLDHEADKPTSRDLGWLYDFYCYWRNVCPTEDFTLRFYYRISRNSGYELYCYANSQFSNEDEFYAAFRPGP